MFKKLLVTQDFKLKWKTLYISVIHSSVYFPDWHIDTLLTEKVFLCMCEFRNMIVMTKNIYKVVDKSVN